MQKSLWSASAILIVMATASVVTPVAAQKASGAASSSSSSSSSAAETTVTIFAHRQYSVATAQVEMASEHPELACMFKMKHDHYKHSTLVNQFNPVASPKEDTLGDSATGNSAVDSAAPSGGSTASAGSGSFAGGSVTGVAASDDFSALDELDPCGADGSLWNNPRNSILYHDASLEKAFAAYDKGDYNAALPLFKVAESKIGYDMAGLMLGRMYLLGQGTPQDVNQAIFWFKKVAEVARRVTPTVQHPNATIEQKFDPKSPNTMSSKSEAAMFLARIYETGYKVPKDPKEARKWYLKADEFGFMPATHVVAEMYLNGYGGSEVNTTKAITYFKRAGSIGYTPSQYALGELYYFGDHGVPQDKTMAGAWLLMAAKGGNAEALYVVGRMYDLGEGGAAVDPQKALLCYKQAAVGGQPDAANLIGTRFYLGDGVAKDLPTARQWFMVAAENGSDEAMFNLAVMLVNGEGGDRDLVRAYAWFSVARQSGNDKAGAALAELAGKMTPEQRAQADALLKPAAKS